MQLYVIRIWIWIGMPMELEGEAAFRGGKYENCLTFVCHLLYEIKKNYSMHCTLNRWHNNFPT